MSFDIGRMLGIDPGMLGKMDEQFAELARDTSLSEQHLGSIADKLDTIGGNIEAILNHVDDMARDMASCAQSLARMERK